MEGTAPLVTVTSHQSNFQRALRQVLLVYLKAEAGISCSLPALGADPVRLLLQPLRSKSEDPKPSTLWLRVVGFGPKPTQPYV